MKRPIIATNEIYHIYNRGVEKRKIFLDDEDRFRFIHDLFEFNDINPVPNLTYYFKSQFKEVGLPKIEREPRKLLVEILAFCLMPNHFHLMVKQKIDGGITLFMRKLGTGYVNYFNQKYKRVGPLFQGKYKIVHLCQDAHFLYLPYYIHLNPLELVIPEWKEKGTKDIKKVMRFLEQYRWSSFPDYIDHKNFPSVTQRNFLLKLFDGPENYRKDTIKWIGDTNIDGDEDKELILE